MAGSKEPQLTMLIALVLGLSVLALAVAWGLRGFVLRQDNGTPEMRKISDAIQEGAQAFLRRQYRTIGLLSIALGVLIYVLYAFFRKPHSGEPAAATLALTTTLSFLFGAFCSGVAGLVGMYVAVRSNIRTASAARSSLNKALQIALRGGAVSGLFVVAMSLFGVGLLYTVLEALHFEPTKIPLMIVGYGFGASFVALFAQLGGGIYTKAADVGADLVGKVEAGIPEDDPRNPAVIADLVGDNVGDCAGRGADLFESTAAENIGAMVLGVLLFPWFGVLGDLDLLLAVRHCRNGDGVPVCLDHAVLHGGPVPTGERNRPRIRDGSRDEHHLRILGRPGGHLAPGHRRRLGAPDFVLARAVDRDSERRNLRDGDRHDGNAFHRGVHPRDGHVRTDRRQRRGDHRDVWHVRGRPPEHGQARRRGEHNESPDERVCARQRGPRGVPTFQRISHRGQSQERGPGPPGDLRGRLHRGGTRIPLHRICDSGGRSRGLGDHQRRPRPVPRGPRHHGRHLEARLRTFGRHRNSQRAQGDDRPRPPGGCDAGRRRPVLPIRAGHARPARG